MKTKSILLLLVSAILLSTTSCNDTDFDPRADWKDITIVYGFINLSDSIHYLRICKAFLGPGNALDMAKEPDSVYYPEGALTVTIKQYDTRTGSLKNTFPLNRVVLDDRDGGIFATNNIAYRFDHPFTYADDRNDSLSLEIEVNGTGKVMRSRSDFVSFVFPTIYHDDYNFPAIKIGNKSATMPLNAVNGVRLAEMYMTYYYGEAPVGTTDRDKFERKSVVWKMTAQEIEESSNGNQVNIKYVPDDFFSFLKETLMDDPSVSRINIGEGYFEVWAGSEELYFYNNVNKPSGVVIDRPEYTNITSNTEDGDDAFGVFTTRYNRGFKVNFKTLSMSDLQSIDRQFIQLP